MKRVVPLLLCLLWFIASNLLADTQYTWPMKLSPELTSKFCDYRSGHFHGGLDIRTGGKTGFKVYAIDDGYIYRANISFRGYGRAVYVKLSDGKIAVYGHLSAFTKSVEDRIFEMQMETEKYSQDLYFAASEYPVKKGDIVGFSGESGSGAPHLHFEVRSTDNNPMNPLLVGSGLKVIDKDNPEFHDLALKYFQPGYLPDGSFENYDQIEIASTEKISEGKYIIPDTIICNQQITLAVSGGDRIAGPGFLYGFYGLKFYVEDSLIFEMRSDSLSFSTTGQLNYIRDFELLKLYGARHKTDNDANIFYRLYIPPLSKQFFWPDFKDKTGYINPSGNIGIVRNARIEAEDESGNRSTLNFYIREPELYYFSSDEAQCCRQGDNILFIFNSPVRPKSKVLEYRNSAIDEFRPLNSTLISHQVISAEQGFYVDTVIATIAKGPRDYRIRYVDNNGLSSHWLYFRESDYPEKLWIGGSRDILRFEFRYGSIDNPPKMHLRNDSLEITGKMRIGGPGLFMTEFSDLNITGPIWIGIESSDSLVFDTTIALYSVIPGRSQDVISSDSTLIMRFSETSAYSPAYIFPSEARRENTPFGPAIIYDIRPVTMLFNSPVRLIFDTKKLDLTGRKMAVYGSSGNGKGWNYISRIDGTKLEANAIGLGKIAILEDIDPPTIKSISPSGKISSKTPLLTCRISDNLSALALENGLSMTIDGKWVPAEYDIDSGRFSYRVKNALKRGEHTLVISAIDNQGNSIVKRMLFTVTGN